MFATSIAVTAARALAQTLGIFKHVADTAVCAFFQATQCWCRGVAFIQQLGSLTVKMEQAATTSEVITRFCQTTTLAIRGGALSTPAAPDKTMERSIAVLQTALRKLESSLSDSSALHESQASQMTSCCNKYPEFLFSRQGVMLDACFTATTAVLDGYQDISTCTARFNPQYFIILTTAFKVLKCWSPVWPSGQLLENQPRLASLDYLLEKVVDIPRHIRSPGYWQEEIQDLIVEIVFFCRSFLQAILLLQWSGYTLKGMITAMPATLLPHIFLFLDRQLYRLSQKSTLTCIGDILVSIQHLITILRQNQLPATFLCSPALDGFLKHLLVMEVTGRLDTACIWHAGMQGFRGTILSLFIHISHDRQNAVQSLPVTPSGDTGIRGQAPTATVHKGAYIRALCLCTTSPYSTFACKKMSAYANTVLYSALEKWRAASGLGVFVLHTWQLECLPSLLIFLTRQARTHIQPLVVLRQQEQQQIREDQKLFDADKIIVQSLVLAISNMVTGLTGMLIGQDN